MDNEPKTRILLGTSGYSYQDWVGPVYPPGTRPADYLAYYAAYFDVAELNFSYYTQPQPAAMKKMLQATNPSFLYIVKAHKSLTHEYKNNRSADDLDEAIAVFKKGVTPLREQERLAAILFQFPYSFHYDNSSRLHLDAICRAFEDFPIAVEFRNDEWQKESVYREFTDRKLTFVNADTPDLAHLPKPAAVSTSSLGYIRFHGKNKANWWHGDNVTRYDYFYNRMELAAWLPKIRQMVEKVRLLLLIFNNHFKGQSFKNALELKELLNQEGLL